MRIVLLGAPGSGKGTQGKLLSSKHHIPQISTGDLLRAAVSAGTTLGRQAKAAMDAGQLVSDEIVLGIIGERLGERDAAKGFILDGFPRNIAQAEALDTMLVERGTPLQAAVLINVEVEVLIERLTGRRTCESCGQMYNVYTSPPRLDDRCDKCGGNLRHRADDNEETISNRLRVYDQQTSPLISYYRTQDKLKTVNGEGDIAGIFAEIEKLLRKLPSGAPPARPADAASAEEKPSLQDLQKKVMAAAAGTPAKEQPAAPKKAPAKKPAAQPPAVKAVAAPAAEPPPAERAPAKKAAAKKVPVKKAPVKKPAAKKKPAVKKPAAKKAVGKKKATVKKGGAKKAVIKRKATAKKPVVKKAAAKKLAVKKSAGKKKPAVKKVVNKKKPSAKKAVVKKPSAKKAVVKKASAKKGGAKKAPSKKKAAAKRRA